jgi:hypothetical protein
MLRLSLAAAVLLPTFALADVKVTPPKGWKANADETKKDDSHTGFTVQVQQWDGPGGAQLKTWHTVFVPFESSVTTSQLVEQLLEQRTRVFLDDGAKLVSKPRTRVVNGLVIAERTLRGANTFLFFSLRARGTAADRLVLLETSCFDHVEDTCKKATATATLTP